MHAPAQPEEIGTSQPAAEKGITCHWEELKYMCKFEIGNNRHVSEELTGGEKRRGEQCHTGPDIN
jgi:hypothetical protein